MTAPDLEQYARSYFRIAPGSRPCARMLDVTARLRSTEQAVRMRAINDALILARREWE